MEQCNHCGNPIAVCSDPNTKWYPQRTICYATMSTRAANAQYDELHESRPYHDGRFENWATERSARFPFHARDGVDIGVSTEDLTPDDFFLGKPVEINAETLGSLG